jgi:uncharacterized protein
LSEVAVNAGREAVAFECEGARLIGVLHRPAKPASVGVVVIVGGPQYRVGSHRQFLLLGEALANAGIACLRFDYRGMGDSEGPVQTFENVSSDIRAAVDELMRRVPQVKRVALWGLCDAASAAMFYAAGDARVRGVVLLNPWARTEQGLARSYLKHYYLRRIVDPNAWAALFRERKSPLQILRSIAATAQSAFGGKKAQSQPNAPVAAAGPAPSADLPDRMARGLQPFRGEVLLILSGDDITAREFVEASGASSRWKKIFARESLKRHDLEASDHTFSRREWRDTVAGWTLDWVKRL